jgi:hypothetical protein
MLARYPKRTVTGAAAALDDPGEPAGADEPADVAEEEEQPTARTAATTAADAASTTRRMEALHLFLSVN